MLDMNESQSVNVVCLKWGSHYPSFYVNRLYAQVKRNLRRPFRFVCVTDDPSGVEPSVDCVPFSEDPGVFGRPWPNLFSKLCLFRRGFADLRGPSLFLDVDLLVIRELDRFFDYRPGDFCIIHNWVELRKRLFRPLPFIGNSSCFRFDAGSDVANRVYEIFLRDKGKRELYDPYFNHGSQKFQTRAMREAGTVAWWPDEWVCSFKRQCIPPFPLNKFIVPRYPKTASIIAFHGRPDIDEAIAGFDGGQKGKTGIRTTHLTCLPTPWVGEAWTCGE